MKLRISSVLILLIALLLPFSRQKPLVLDHNDDPFVFHLQKESLKIAQFTDLHLAFGFDANDRKTLKLISNITAETKPDLIVLSGDQTLSITAPARHRQLIRHMESLKTPWTFVFGNHEADYHKMERLLKVIFTMNTKYMYFKVGPLLENGGYGNFTINYLYEDNPFYNLYLLDSKAELKIPGSGRLFVYDYFSEAQVDWYHNKVMIDKINNIKSTVFAHIPLIQYADALLIENKDKVKGIIGERISHQEVDTGFFNAMVESTVSEAFFAGHDHLNNFTFEKDGIILGYGQISGYNGYGTLRRGARIIEIDESKMFKTYVVYEDLSYEY